MTKHAELIAKLEVADHGSYEIDGEILNVAVLHGFDYKGGPVPLFSDSIDAALALAERVLPGYWWLVRSDEGESDSFANMGLIGTNPNMGAPCYPAFAPTPALALCISILRALEAQQ